MRTYTSGHACICVGGGLWWTHVAESNSTGPFRTPFATGLNNPIEDRVRLPRKPNCPRANTHTVYRLHELTTEGKRMAERRQTATQYRLPDRLCLARIVFLKTDPYLRAIGAVWSPVSRPDRPLAPRVLGISAPKSQLLASPPIPSALPAPHREVLLVRSHPIKTPLGICDA